MHILTKVFAVFASVLSLVLATLTMSMAFNISEVSSALRDAEATAAQEKSQKDAEVNRAASERSRLEAQMTDAFNEIARLRGVNTDIASENARLRSEVSREREAAQAIQTQIGDFDKTVAAQTRLIESYRDQINQLRGDNSRIRSESLAIEDRLNDRESELGVLNQQIRALQEQLAAVETSMQGGSASATTAAGQAARPFEFTGPVITTRVSGKAVDPASGKQLVELAAGSTDRLANNMKLFVTRGNQWVADITVVRTDLNQAVARVELSAPGQVIQPGDIVLSRLR